MICQDRLGTDEHKRRRTQENTRWFCAGDDGDDASAVGRDTGCPDTEEAGWCSRIPSVAEVRKTICNWDTAAACAMTHDHLSRQARDKQKEKKKTVPELEHKTRCFLLQNHTRRFAPGLSRAIRRSFPYLRSPGRTRWASVEVRETTCLSRSIYHQGKNDQFAQTGSGQTEGNAETGGVFRRAVQPGGGRCHARAQCAPAGRVRTPDNIVLLEYE
eukprot:COSAG06_NODE_7300_length_2552_cov_1915.299633_4_plen_215_part_00